jgi:hypothetical protein
MPESLVSVRRLPALPRRVARPASRVVRAAGFWLAVALPIVYLPLAMLAPGVLADPTVLGGVIGGNLLALAVGHDHEPGLATRRQFE